MPLASTTCRGEAVTEAAANIRAKPRPGRAHKWGNRRPAGKRPALTPEEAERREERKRAGQRKAFIGSFVTDAEKETIAARAAAYGMMQSDFIRTVLLSDLKEPPPARTDPDALRRLAFELSKVGTNLNQLAKRANEAARIGGEKELEALLAMETELRSLTAQIAGTLAHVIEL